MFQFKSLPFLLMAFAVIDAAPASAKDPVGEAIAVRKTVRAEDRVLDVGGGVYRDEKLRTDLFGSGEFVFDDGAKLAVGPNATVVLDDFVVGSGSRFKKLGISTAKGSMRWISGKSASSAYKISTVRGTLGIRGTMVDMTTSFGRAHLLLLSGAARFCDGGGRCQNLTRPCDYIVADSKGISKAQPLSKSFKSRQVAGGFFPFQSNPKRVSAGFQAKTNCLATVAVDTKEYESKSQPENHESESEENF